MGWQEKAWAPRAAQEGTDFQVCVPSVISPPRTHTYRDRSARCVQTHVHVHTHAHVHSPALHPRPRHTRGKTALTLAPSQCSLWLLFQTTGFNLCASVALRENTLTLQHRTFRGLDRARGARGPQGRGAHAHGHSWAHTRSLPGGVFLPGTPGGGGGSLRVSLSCPHRVSPNINNREDVLAARSGPHPGL